MQLKNAFAALSEAVHGEEKVERKAEGKRGQQADAKAQAEPMAFVRTGEQKEQKEGKDGEQQEEEEEDWSQDLLLDAANRILDLGGKGHAKDQQLRRVNTLRVSCSRV